MTGGTSPAPSTRRVRRPPLVAVALAMAALWLSVPVPGYAFAGGTWGAGAYPYLNGLVCTTTSGGVETQRPLVAWDVGGATPGYVTQALTSSAGTDSAAPPLPQVGPQTLTPVTTATPGFGSSHDIAVYAALLERFGSGADTAQTAEVANAVITKVSWSGPGCDDTAAEAALLSTAERLAGPYTVVIDSPPTATAPGDVARVRTVVRSASGAPVPGVTLALTASGGILGSSSAVTGADGAASFDITVPRGTTAATVAVSATARLPVGLEEVTAATTPSPSDPSGEVATALRTAAPAAIVGHGAVRVDRSAHPVLAVSAAPTALVVGGSSTPTAAVSGMNGHGADVQIVVAGPVPFSQQTLCARLRPADFRGAAATKYTVTTTGDVTAKAGPWQPTEPGCYRITAELTTTDSTPPATAHAAAATPITVLDASATASTPIALVGAGSPATGQVTVSGSEGLPGSVAVRLLGPVAPAPSGQCAAADFTGARSGAAVSVPLPADSTGAAARFTVNTGGVGCYRVAGDASLALPGGARLHVPITDGPAVLAIAPQISYDMNRLWAFRAGSVSARATVIGTYGAPAHVNLRLTRAADTATTGCRAADFAQPSPPLRGPPVPVSADLKTVTVSSGPLDETGCYAPVAVLTMDANPRITATATFVALRSAVEVGLDPATTDTGRLIHQVATPTSGTAQVVTSVVFGLLSVGAVAYAAGAAWRGRRAARNDRGLSRLLPD